MIIQIVLLVLSLVTVLQLSCWKPTTEDVGIMDAILRTDGKGLPFLHMKAGGSVCPPSYFTVDNHMHYIYQEGRTVFKYAVSNMSDVSAAIGEKWSDKG